MNSTVIKDYSGDEPIVLGGIGDKKSNNGTQYFQQNRIYTSLSVSTAVTTVCMPFFVVIDDKKKLILR